MHGARKHCSIVAVFTMIFDMLWGKMFLIFHIHSWEIDSIDSFLLHSWDFCISNGTFRACRWVHPTSIACQCLHSTRKRCGIIADLSIFLQRSQVLRHHCRLVNVSTALVSTAAGFIASFQCSHSTRKRCGRLHCRLAVFAQRSQALRQASLPTSNVCAALASAAAGFIANF